MVKINHKQNHKSRDIRSFFGSSQVPSSQPPSQPSPPPRPSSPPPPPAASFLDASSLPASPSPLHRSSPSTPFKPEPRQAVDRSAVIAASDDEDGYSSSDSDLPDLFAGFAPKTTTAPTTAATPTKAAPLRKSPRNLRQACVTPRAKRTATAQEFHSSPLTIQSKRQRFDFDSILALNQQYESACASSRRFAELLDQEKKGKTVAKQALHDHTDGDNADNDASTEDEATAARCLKERMIKSAIATAASKEGEEEEDGVPGGMRVARALERADVGDQPRSYFFFEQGESERSLPTIVGKPFPKAAAKYFWSILENPKDRTRHFLSGLPFDIQTQFGNIPDEIFLWVLDAMCTETRRDLATEYVKLLKACGSQLERLVTSDRLKQLFRNLGATKDVERLTSRITLQTEFTDSYSRRNWLCLENFLKFLAESSTSLSPSTRATAMQILLRLAMDPVALENVGLLQEWRWTVDLIARSVPGVDWMSFCQDVCASIYASTEKATLRYRAIAGLGPVQQQHPNTSADLQRRTLHLRRCLASVFFFDDLKRADTRPEDTVTIRAVVDRLEEDEFQLNAETDFSELKALLLLLNIALGDASKHRVSIPLTVTTSALTGDQQLCQNFDFEVDELAKSMQNMAARVAPLSKGIHVPRIEAKNAMELIRERLLYQVRIRPLHKYQTFADDDNDNDISLPKQQSFMREFFSKERPKSVTTLDMGTEMVA